MPEDENGYAYIENVSEEECFERWDGVDWKPIEEGSSLGICKSDFDFDTWVTEHEKQEMENEN